MTRVLYAQDADQEAAAAVWRAGMDVHAESMHAAVIDLYPTSDWDLFAGLPEQTKQAWEVLAAEARQRHAKSGRSSSDPLWRVSFELDKPHLRDALRDYGWASIYVQVFGHHQLEIITADDSGRMIEIWFDDDSHVEPFTETLRQEGLDPDALLAEESAESQKRLRLGQR